MAEYCEVDFPGAQRRWRAAFADPELVLEAKASADVVDVLRRAEALARAGRWVVGFVAYESAGAFDPALRTSATSFPLAWFAVFGSEAPPVRGRGDFLCGPWRDSLTRQAFDEGVGAIREGIARGDYYQVNLTGRLHSAFLGDGLAFFEALKASQPSAYCAYLDIGRWQVCSVSPELFFHWHPERRELRSRPMKGTAARSDDPRQDAEAAASLGRSPKDRAENLMIVDLIRNDMSRVSEFGSVSVPELFTVESWPTVWQMTSTVISTTKREAGLADIFAALFPCGSVTGAPKAAAMAAIRGLEPSPRNVYCGAIGVIRPGGEATFSVGIRTVTVDRQSGTAECGIGSGIVLDSTRDAEFDEWLTKRRFLDRATPTFELLETLRLHRGRYWLRQGHMTRLARSAAALGFRLEPGAIDAALDTLARVHRSGDWRVRLLSGPDGEVRAEALVLDPLPEAPFVRLANGPIASGNPWLAHKTTRRGLYEAAMIKAPGIFDTLLFNERGEATEFTRGNLVAEIGDRCLTPPLASGVLPGVLRQALISRRRIVEAAVAREDLYRAKSLWFINSVRGAVRVRLA